ncbi:tripartite tricarboxylate transporter TctB family protein [Microbulbifer sp. S227A]|uniref:tripartite tricarboxylate transporter TctB family protein n=1 Tax=Microbulbifer sp. S227A TaxID=3415131 RepID=UPI003C7AE5F7
MTILSPEYRGEALCLLLLAATGVALLVGAAALPAPMFDPLGPAGLPRWIGWLLLGLTGLRAVVLAAATRGRKPAAAPAGPRPDIRRLAFVSAITLAYLALLTAKVLPFTWVTLGFLAALGAAMGDLSVRRLITVLAIAVGMSLALTHVFADLLSVVLPQ